MPTLTLSSFEWDQHLARLDLPDLRINYDPIDPDQFERPINSFCIETGQDNEELPLHSHKKGQLVVASHGSVMCRAPGGLWIVPPQGAGRRRKSPPRCSSASPSRWARARWRRARWLPPSKSRRT